jgi:integrase/recombinase XerD
VGVRCVLTISAHHLAAIRMLFDWLVTGHVIDVNPAHVLNADEARALLDSIDISTLISLCSIS